MDIVIIESPYIHQTVQGLGVHRHYLKLCLTDSMERGEAPFAAHGYFTSWLNDRDKRHRELGFRLTRPFLHAAALVAVYTDLGISTGMSQGIEIGRRAGKPIVYRALGVTFDSLKETQR